MLLLSHVSTNSKNTAKSFGLSEVDGCSLVCCPMMGIAGLSGLAVSLAGLPQCVHLFCFLLQWYRSERQCCGGSPEKKIAL